MSWISSFVGRFSRDLHWPVLGDPRGGEAKEVLVPEDLYVRFGSLGTKPEEIIRFARRYGYLGGGLDHFHRKSDGLAQRGESLAYWVRQIECFKDTMELWLKAKQDGPRAVQRELDSLRAPFPAPVAGGQKTWLTFPSAWIATDPVEYAKATVIATINRGLAEHWQQNERCTVEGCPDPDPFDDSFNITRGQLRRGRRGQINLAIVSGTLIKTLWLQLAAYVAGLRTVKRCAAPDCKLGHLMDVTLTERPGAWTMHPECRERFKKRRRRMKLGPVR
jgi:hypothetical protein